MTLVLDMFPILIPGMGVDPRPFHQATETLRLSHNRQLAILKLNEGRMVLLWSLPRLGQLQIV